MNDRAFFIPRHGIQVRFCFWPLLHSCSGSKAMGWSLGYRHTSVNGRNRGFGCWIHLSCIITFSTSKNKAFSPEKHKYYNLPWNSSLSWKCTFWAMEDLVNNVTSYTVAHEYTSGLRRSQRFIFLISRSSRFGPEEIFCWKFKILELVPLLPISSFFFFFFSIDSNFLFCFIMCWPKFYAGSVSYWWG